MGKVTGFLEYQRLQEAAEAPRGAQEALARVRRSPHRRGGEGPGRALHGLRHPVLHERLPGQQHHPGLERPRLPAGLEARDRDAALDQQLPRVHRPHLPRAVRGGLHAAHQQRPGRHQVDRARDHRQGLGSGLGPAAAAGAQDRQDGRGRRLGPRRPRLRAAARARRARRGGVREERPHRRAAALRHPRLQDGEVAHRPPPRADARRGRRVPHRRVRREGAARQRDRERREENGGSGAARRPVRRGGARRRRRAAARPPDSRARPRRRALRDGVPAAAEPARGRRQGRPRALGDRQARRRDRRRRHRLRLRRHVEPARRQVGDAVRAAADAAGGRSESGVAVLAGAPAHLLVARGRLPPRLGRDHQVVPRRERQGASRSSRCA